MKNLWLVAVGLLGGLLGAGLLLLVSSPPRGQAVKLLPPPTPPLIAVYVVGAVSQPGVYNLSPGSRVQDALQAAGGLLAEANLSVINLAAPLRDGMQISVPVLVTQTIQSVWNGSTEVYPQATDDLTGVTDQRSFTLPAPTVSGPIDINTASLEELDRLPGIGPVYAQRIIDYRQTNGPFFSIEAIQDVPGIGPATFERIKDMITVSNP